jgi:hypothetical protein
MKNKTNYYNLSTYSIVCGYNFYKFSLQYSTQKLPFLISQRDFTCSITGLYLDTFYQKMTKEALLFLTNKNNEDIKESNDK